MGFLRPHTDRIGRRGERLAARHLRRRGYRILARRWRTPAGEIDLLCLHHAVLVVVEVKTTRSGSVPASRIDAAKRRRLRSAIRYVSSLRRESARLDVVLVRLRPRHVQVEQDVIRS